MSDNERTIVVRVLKFDPQSAVSKPHFKEYQLKETPSMTLFIALNLIREHQDPDLSFD